MMQQDAQGHLTRRDWIRTAGAAGVAAGIGSIGIRGAAAADTVKLKAGDVVLFQGDSITDAQRNRKENGANDLRGLGRGYATMVSAGLMGRHPSLKLQCYNRGVSGDKVPDLHGRWEDDTIALAPDVLSVLIGVNDYWHTLGGNYDGTVKDYATGLAELLARTRASLPDTTIVVCEPFVLRCGAVNEKWFPEFDERRAAAQDAAATAGTVWVPFQQAFNDALSAETPPEYWAGDGVHPTTAGHALMAQVWLEATGLA